MRRFALCWSVLVLAGCDCSGENPGLVDGGGDAGPPIDAGPLADAAEVDGAAGDAGSADAGPPPECAVASECNALRGAPPCGSWECTGGACVANCPGCTTDLDGDGYGAGSGCAGPDCDDADRNLGEDGSRSCYSGQAGTEGMGVCRAGVQACAGGVLGSCGGEVVPGGEACNDADDDCDGDVDEDLGDFTCGIGACAATEPACSAGVVGVCMPGTGATDDSVCDSIDDDCDGLVDEDCGCVTVAPTGNDTTAVTGDNLTPFRSIQAAIDWAAADATRPRQVCVAAGAACGASTNYQAAVTMSDGISVYGRYESTTWTRCGNSTVTIRPGVDVGVLFPDTISSTTVLAGFRVERHNSATTAGVTLDGATNVTLADLVIDNTPTVTSSYGINLINGAEALITRSVIYAGNGDAESYGVRSVGSRPTIRDNCNAYDSAGRCNDFCGATNRAIRGRFTAGPGVTAAVYLQDSPNAVVEQTAMCGNDADEGSGIRVRGDATGLVIRANLINAWGGADDSHGIWLEDCGGAAPWIVDNTFIAAAGDSINTRVDGIRAIGDCHPVIDTNLQITGGAEGGTLGANGVYCGASAIGASRCAVLGNLDIEGSGRAFPPTSVGVRCDDGGCLRIEGNRISGRGGQESWGIYLGASGTFIRGNEIIGGCASVSSIGIHAEGAYARIENNFVHAYDLSECTAGMVGNVMRSTALHVVPTNAPGELDVHSNTLEAHANASGASCTAIGIHIDPTNTYSAGPSGIYRNNIVRVVECATRVNVREEAVSGDPRVFENNDLDPTRGPAALYVDEGTTNLTMASEVDALGYSGTRSVDPSFLAYPTDLHIDVASMCIGAGTANGAPAVDYDGDARSATAPSIGADEG
jgi:hypothetical protein